MLQGCKRMTSKHPGTSLTRFFNDDHVESLIYLPPDQPVLTSHAVAPCLFILSANIAAYLLGWSMMKAAPKQAENVAVGSFTPSTVPAT
jgi:hypothetical protein